MPRKHKALRIELFFCYLENIQTAEHVFHAYFEHFIYLFFPKTEKWTYRFGCAFRSTSRESAEITAASM